MDFNINKEWRKVLELIDKSLQVRRFVYFLVVSAVVSVVLWRLPEILTALK